jgi:hypothetical protein
MAGVSSFSASYAIEHGLAYATESRREPVYGRSDLRNVMMPHLKQIGAFRVPSEN